MRLLILSLLLILNFNTNSIAQLKKLKELELTGISKPSVDRLGNFYFAFEEGKIAKYDPNGKLLDTSLKTFSPLTLIESWNPLKVFLYSQKEKKIQFLDHHLSELDTRLFDPSLTVNPLLVCPGNENNKFWIFDNVELAIKKVDISTSHIDVNSPVEEEWSNLLTHVVFMREYQNMVFLLDSANGIFIFNNLGKAIIHIAIAGLSFFNFMGEELCYRDEGKVVLMDIYTGNKRTIAELPESKDILFTIITDERLVVGRKKKVIFYNLTL